MFYLLLCSLYADVFHHPFFLGVQVEGACGNMAVTKGRPHLRQATQWTIVLQPLYLCNSRSKLYREVLSRQDVEDGYVEC